MDIGEVNFFGKVKWILNNFDFLKKDVRLKYLCILEYFWYVVLGVL